LGSLISPFKRSAAAKVAVAYDVVAFEHAARLMPGEFHRDTLREAPPHRSYI
jgi:hypothetical protein